MHNPLPAQHHPVDNSSIYSHSRSRTTSSNTFPNPIAPSPMHLQQPSPTAPYHGYHAVGSHPYGPSPYNNPQSHATSHRSPSVNTFNSIGSNQGVPPAAYRTSPTNDLRRSVSSRSGNVSPQPVSYVALLRKQKATVWCDRSQYEDPRVLAHFKAAKAKASMDLVGGGHSSIPGRTSTGISAGKLVGKVRHHAKPGTTSYTPDPNTYVGVGGVPMRLSATEVEGGESDDDDTTTGNRLHHRRTGSSGRSSSASVRRASQFRSSSSLTQRRWSPGHTPERTGSMVQEMTPIQPENTIDDRASGKARSTGSGSSAERADNVAELGDAPKLASNSLMHHALTREKSVRNPEDLKRRGSVDERTMTLTSGRLFIANPD